MNVPAKFGLVWVLLFVTLPFGGACGVFAQPRGISPADRSDTILQVQPKISDSDAEQKIRQQINARKREEQADRVAAAKLRTVRRTAVNSGGYRLIQNQVSPPAFPEAPPPPVELAGPAGHPSIEVCREKEFRTLSFSATVYDRRFTYLRWEHEGQTCSAWSSIDFNYLREVNEFETADTRYLLMMGIGNGTSEEFTAANRIMEEEGIEGDWPKEICAAARFSSGEAAYFIESAPGSPPDPATLAGLEALHAFYGRNAAQLQIDFRNQEKLNAARERYEVAHPEPPRDAILNFWMHPWPRLPADDSPSDLSPASPR